MPGCELMLSCLYYNDSTYGMAQIDKERYCQQNYGLCARYLVFKARQRELKQTNSLGRPEGAGDDIVP